MSKRSNQYSSTLGIFLELLVVFRLLLEKQTLVFLNSFNICLLLAAIGLRALVTGDFCAEFYPCRST